MINWIPLTTKTQIQQIINHSTERPCVIYKHSTRCNLSAMAQFRLEEDWQYSNEEIEPYFLDILKYRDLSNLVADTFSVYHQSPQLLLIKNKECIYEADHLEISVADLAEGLEDDFWL